MDFLEIGLHPVAKAPKLGVFGHMGYPSVLMIVFYHISPIPEVPIHSVWTGSVRDVAWLFTKIQKYFCTKGPRSAIKTNALYCTTWPFSGGQ